MRAFLVLLLGVCLAACTVGPDFQRPVVRAPSVWGPERTDVPSRTVAAAVDSEWWRRISAFNRRQSVLSRGGRSARSLHPRGFQPSTSNHNTPAPSKARTGS